MTEETSALLSALNKLDGAITDVMIGLLLTDTLSPQEQAEFGELLTTTAKLVHQHPNSGSAGHRRLRYRLTNPDA